MGGSGRKWQEVGGSGRKEVGLNNMLEVGLAGSRMWTKTNGGRREFGLQDRLEMGCWSPIQVGYGRLHVCVCVRVTA